MSDQDFEYFLTKFPHTETGPVCTQRHIDTYTGLVPDTLISYWRDYGFAGFGNGILWLTDPIEWQKTTSMLTEGMVHPDLGAHATYIPYARTAYGKTYFWTPGFGCSLFVDPVNQSALYQRSGDSRDVTLPYFFAAAKQWKFDETETGDADEPGLFAPCLEKLGPVAYNEVYGYVPALAVGGKASVEHTTKFDVHVHLNLLRQFAGSWDTAYLNI